MISWIYLFITIEISRFTQAQNLNVCDILGIHEEDGACYWVTDVEYNITDGAVKCNERGGIPARVIEQSHQEFLADLISDSYPHVEDVYIGVQKTGVNVFTGWLGNTLNHTNWNDYEPEVTSSKDCVVAEKVDQFKWHTVSCSHSYYVACSCNMDNSSPSACIVQSSSNTDLSPVVSLEVSCFTTSTESSCTATTTESSCTATSIESSCTATTTAMSTLTEISTFVMASYVFIESSCTATSTVSSCTETSTESSCTKTSTESSCTETSTESSCTETATESSCTETSTESSCTETSIEWTQTRSSYLTLAYATNTIEIGMSDTFDDSLSERAHIGFVSATSIMSDSSIYNALSIDLSSEDTDLVSGISPTLTANDLQKKIESLTKAIEVDRRQTSNFLRKFYSASDPRTSSAVIGVFGVIFVSLVTIIIIGLDVPILMLNFKTTFNRLRDVVNRNGSLQNDNNKITERSNALEKHVTDSHMHV